MWNEAQLQAVWYGNAPPSLGMRCAAGLYRAVTGLRRAGYHADLLRRHRLPVPVLVVGNITVGGTGKTPLTIALAEALAARGWTPGVVSRGYGGSQREPTLLEPGADAARFGDEPCLMQQAGCARVAVGRDRPAAARLLVQAGADLVIADDGLQHYALARDAEICVIDGQRRFGNARLLPAGPLREPLARLTAVGWRVCNGGTPAEGEISMQLEGSQALPLAGGEPRSLADFTAAPVHAVAGIGNPDRFFASLREQGLQVVEHPFSDHHTYTAEDLAFDTPHAVLMTDKDAIKCTQLDLPNAWRLPVQARLPGHFLDAVDTHLRTAAAFAT